MLDNKQNNYLNLLSKLEVLNPITTLKRGYTVTRCNNKIINDIKLVKKGDKMLTEVTNGKIESVIENVYE